MAFFNKKRGAKILFVASEAGPFMKVGGLGEVMYSLPKALRALGHDARVLIPKYATLDQTKFPLVMEASNLKPIPVEQDPYGLFVSNVLKYDLDGQTIAYFLENKEYYEKRANVYGYSDDAVRWALLAKCVPEFILHSEWQPDIIVASDWQTGLISNFLHTEYKNDPVLSKIAVVFTIHNLAYQGGFDIHQVNPMDNDDGHSAIPAFNDPRLLKLNFMRRGIMHSDVINTVSPTYAQEVTTAEYGELLDDLLRERRSRLFGILNGIDYDSYNPETDPHLANHYSAKSLENRLANRSVLRHKFNLNDSPDAPLLGIVSRLTDQKGLNLVVETAEAILDNFNAQFIVLGSGEGHLVSFFEELAKKYPQRVAGHFTFDEILPYLIIGGADAILIPSRFEPSGLTQMESQRYGAVPIVRKTGGLADTVTDYNPQNKKGTGFVFEKMNGFAFYGAVVRALETYRYPKFWRGIQERGMTMDFSWDKSARKYLELFNTAIQFHKQSQSKK